MAGSLRVVLLGGIVVGGSLLITHLLFLTHAKGINSRQAPVEAHLSRVHQSQKRIEESLRALADKLAKVQAEQDALLDAQTTVNKRLAKTLRAGAAARLRFSDVETSGRQAEEADGPTAGNADADADADAVADAADSAGGAEPGDAADMADSDAGGGGDAGEGVEAAPEAISITHPAAAAADMAGARAAAAAAADAAGGGSDVECPGRKPYHALLTAQANTYQQWQARIMYFHWKKQAAADGPCTDMAGFTRLCATVGAKPDGLEGEIPTIFTEALPEELVASHFHFYVLNRPESVRQMLASRAMLARIKSDFVLLLETDHVLMRPIPNLATPTTPAAFVFGYMHAHRAQDFIIKRYWPEGSFKGLQPVGPSPLLIHLDQLRALTPRWLNFSLGLRSNGDAERVMQGWVQEMWGYSIAAASVGIKHRLVPHFQVEYGSLSGAVPEDFHTRAYVFHYTYGIEYTLGGQPQGINQIGEWSLDKRHYGADHPPRDLEPPPQGANAAARWLTAAWNEASAGIKDWPESHSMGTIGWRREKISAEQMQSSPLAQRVHGAKWSWGGTPGFEFGSGGVLTTPWGTGSWGMVSSAAAAGGEAEEDDGIKRCTGCLFADFANANHNLRFNFDVSPPTFKSIRVGDLQVVHGAMLPSA